MVDYFSKYPEVIPVKNKTAETIIKVMKAIFARYRYYSACSFC